MKTISYNKTLTPRSQQLIHLGLYGDAAAKFMNELINEFNIACEEPPHNESGKPTDIYRKKMLSRDSFYLLYPKGCNPNDDERSACNNFDKVVHYYTGEICLTRPATGWSKYSSYLNNEIVHHIANIIQRLAKVQGAYAAQQLSNNSNVEIPQSTATLLKTFSSEANKYFNPTNTAKFLNTSFTVRDAYLIFKLLSGTPPSKLVKHYSDKEIKNFVGEEHDLITNEAIKTYIESTSNLKAEMQRKLNDDLNDLCKGLEKKFNAELKQACQKKINEYLNKYNHKKMNIDPALLPAQEVSYLEGISGMKFIVLIHND